MSQAPVVVAPGGQVAGRMASFSLHGAETEAEGCRGPAWVVGGLEDLQTKLPDFTTSSLCLWTGMGLRAPQHFTTWRLLPAHRAPRLESLPSWPSPPPSLCCLCLILILLLEGVASTPPIPVPRPPLPPGGMESTPEPGGWAWPCTDFSCTLQEKGSKSRERGGRSPQFLRVPPPCPSLVPNSHNLFLELFCGL